MPENDLNENISIDEKKKKKKRTSLLTVIGIIIFLVGAGFVAYPYIGSFFVTQSQKEIVSKIEEVIAQAQNPERLAARETREFAFEDASSAEDTGDGFKYDEASGYITWTVDAAPQSEEDDIDVWFDPSTGEQLETVQSEVELIPGSTLPPNGKRVLVLRGMLRIDKINVYLPIVDGTGATQLRYGVGRWRGGVMLGQEGNCLIAGHRNYTFGTIFNRLNEVEIGDEIIATDLDGNVYTYIIDNINVFLPGDISIVEAMPGERRITLQTCHPLYVGSHRLIVQGTLKDDGDSVEFEIGDY